MVASCSSCWSIRSSATKHTSRNFANENFHVSSDIGTRGVVTRPHFLHILHMYMLLPVLLDLVPLADSPPVVDSATARVAPSRNTYFCNTRGKKRIINKTKNDNVKGRRPKIRSMCSIRNKSIFLHILHCGDFTATHPPLAVQKRLRGPASATIEAGYRAKTWQAYNNTHESAYIPHITSAFASSSTAQDNPMCSSCSSKR